MAPIKSTSSIARVLRAKTPASNPRVLNTVNRNLTRTAKNATSIESTINSQSSTSTPLLNQGISRLASTHPLSMLNSHIKLPDHFQPQYPSHYSPSPIENTIPTNPFSSLVTEITSSLTTTPKPDLPALTKLLRSYTSDPAHWTKFAFPDPNAQYTRNLVAEVPGLFNLLLLVWTPGKASPVHDHAEAHCLMKVRFLSFRPNSIAVDPLSSLSILVVSLVTLEVICSGGGFVQGEDGPQSGTAEVRSDADEILNRSSKVPSASVATLSLQNQGSKDR